MVAQLSLDMTEGRPVREKETQQVMHAWEVEQRDQQYLEGSARVAVEAASCKEEDGWRAG